MKNSILFMSFGQSNADCHNAGPAFVSPALDDPRIVLPNDGFGFRGLLGRKQPKRIDNFVQAYGYDPKCQSSGVAAAVRFLNDTNDDSIEKVIVRSAAKGGRPLIGKLHKDRIISGIFREHDGRPAILMLHMIEEIYQIAAAAEDMGAPLRSVYIPFFHGEADQSTPNDAYITLLTEMMDIVDSAVAEIGLPTYWILTQASGTAPTHAGNAWESRLGIKTIAEKRSNAIFASANYALPLIDSAHLSAKGKVLAGERVGACAALFENGLPKSPLTIPINAVAHGKDVHVAFQTPVQTVIDRNDIPSPQFTDGFQITGQPMNFVTEAVPTEDGHLIIRCADHIPANCYLNYAFARRQKHDPAITDDSYPFGRGCLRTTRSMQSLILPDTAVHEWVPAFSIPVQNAA